MLVCRLVTGIRRVDVFIGRSIDRYRNLWSLRYWRRTRSSRSGNCWTLFNRGTASGGILPVVCWLGNLDSWRWRLRPPRLCGRCWRRGRLPLSIGVDRLGRVLLVAANGPGLCSQLPVWPMIGYLCLSLHVTPFWSMYKFGKWFIVRVNH